MTGLANQHYSGHNKACRKMATKEIWRKKWGW